VHGVVAHLNNKPAHGVVAHLNSNKPVHGVVAHLNSNKPVLGVVDRLSSKVIAGAQAAHLRLEMRQLIRGQLP